METYMKFTFPALMITTLLVASPALAQYGSPSTTSTPSATKGDSWSVTERVKKRVASQKQKKHMANYNQRRHTKAMSSKPQTTGSGNSSATTPSTNKGDAAPKSQ
jgi:hypothetical protein